MRHINPKHYLARLIVEYFLRGLKHVINTRFFYTQRLFLTQPQRCLTFYWTKPQMLFKSCLIDIDLMLPWLFLDLLYFLWLCLRQVYLYIVRMIYFSLLSLTWKNICNLIDWDVYNIDPIYTLLSIFVFFDLIRKNKKYNIQCP